MKLSEIQELIRFVAKSGVTEIELELKDFKINIKTPARKRRGGLVDPSEVVADGNLAVAPVPPTQVVVASAPVAVVSAAAPATELAAATAAPADNSGSADGEVDESQYITI
ncbi:MAG: hypothetical protein JKX73_05090, partial [Flavobacteriales bacterium]|nr:hypothetical protein [Flavobacteriales bacterium]